MRHVVINPNMIKKTLFIFASVVLVMGCDVNNSSSNSQVEFERLDSLYQFNDIYPAGYIFNSQYRWELFWKANTGDGSIYNNHPTDIELPDVNFDDKTLIGVFYDRKGQMHQPKDPEVYYRDDRLVVELDSLVHTNNRDATWVPYLLITVDKTDADIHFTGNIPNN